MKIEKWREMTRTDLERKLVELKDSMLKTQVKVQTKQLENTSVLSATRKDIARILTLLKAMPAQNAAAPAAAPAVEKKPAAPAQKKAAKAGKTPAAK